MFWLLERGGPVCLWADTKKGYHTYAKKGWRCEVSVFWRGRRGDASDRRYLRREECQSTHLDHERCSISLFSVVSICLLRMEGSSDFSALCRAGKQGRSLLYEDLGRVGTAVSSLRSLTR